MGLSIRLTINPNQITAAPWAAVYDESLLLLTQFPLPLVRFTEETAHGQRRYLYTTKIIENAGTTDEHWHIVGDGHSRPYVLLAGDCFGDASRLDCIK